MRVALYSTCIFCSSSINHILRALRYTPIFVLPRVWMLAVPNPVVGIRAMRCVCADTDRAIHGVSRDSSARTPRNGKPSMAGCAALHRGWCTRTFTAMLLGDGNVFAQFCPLTYIFLGKHVFVTSFDRTSRRPGPVSTSTKEEIKCFLCTELLGRMPGRASITGGPNALPLGSSKVTWAVFWVALSLTHPIKNKTHKHSGKCMSFAKNVYPHNGSNFAGGSQ